MTNKQETTYYNFIGWCIENEVSHEHIKLNEETGMYEGLTDSGAMVEFPEIYQEVITA